MRFLTQFGYSIPGYDSYGSYGGDDYLYAPDFNSMMSELSEGFFSAFIGFFAGLILVTLLLCALIYVFHSLALYTMAKRRGIANPWLAWVPVGSLWIMGSLSDQYRYLTAGKVTHNRFILLGLELAGLALSIVSSVSAVSGDYLQTLALAAMLTMPAALLSVVCIVFYYIALYDIYQSANPDNSVTALVVSILIGVSIPVFLFVYRKQDGGMPPRREEPEAVYAEPVILPEEAAPAGEAAPQETPTAEETAPEATAPVEESAAQEPENTL